MAQTNCAICNLPLDTGMSCPIHGSQFASHTVSEDSRLKAAESRLAAVTRQRDELRDRVTTLWAAIAHGDDDHRQWLGEAIRKHFAGEPVTAPRGQGKTERERDEIAARCVELADQLAGLVAAASDGAFEGEWIELEIHKSRKCLSTPLTHPRGGDGGASKEH